MQRGSLIIYDSKGKIFLNTGDAEGDILPHTLPSGLPYRITEFGELDGKRVLGVDVTVTPHRLITEDIVTPLTPEQQQIQELENQLLIAENESIGGIL